MAHIMTQASAQEKISTLSHVMESTINEEFNSRNLSANTRRKNNDYSLLEQEAFPGELASLRAQLKEKSIGRPAPENIRIPLQTVSDAPITYIENSNQLADQLIDVMPTGLVVLDGNGIVVKINQVARNLLDEPILGQPWFNVITRSFTPKEDDWHEVSLKDGRRVKLEITSLGSEPGQLIMITDLTETRLLQDKLAQMQRLSSLGKMVSTLAHQIRTPLSAAILYSENLSSHKLAETARLKFQGKLNARLHDLEQQVNDMLLFSKSGKEQVVSPVNVSALINKSVTSMDALLTKAKTHVNVQLSEETLYILGNENALAGAIQNLLHNALNALCSAKVTEPIINIQIYSQDSHVYVSVKDNGPGIKKTISDKIFQPFFTSSSKGTGLGLAVVKSVVNAHQGDVDLLNQSLNKLDSGAHFVIKLPLLTQGEMTKNSITGEK